MAWASGRGTSRGTEGSERPFSALGVLGPFKNLLAGWDSRHRKPGPNFQVWQERLGGSPGQVCSGSPALWLRGAGCGVRAVPLPAPGPVGAAVLTAAALRRLRALARRAGPALCSSAAARCCWRTFLALGSTRDAGGEEGPCPRGDGRPGRMCDEPLDAESGHSMD